MAKAKHKVVTKVIDRDEEREKRGSLDDHRGPTEQRFNRAGTAYDTGDDKRGGKLYHFLDAALDRLYARLYRSAKSENAIERLRFEYAALSRYHRAFVEGGMLGNIGAVDCNRTYSPNPFGRMFLAANERQLDDRDSYWHARTKLDKEDRTLAIVVDNVVLHGNSLELAGYCVGKESKTRAIKAAETILREAGYLLAKHWGMVRG